MTPKINDRQFKVPILIHRPDEDRNRKPVFVHRHKRGIAFKILRFLKKVLGGKTR